LGYIELDVDGVSTGSFSCSTGFEEAVAQSPETLNFWFDFMDVEGEIGKYAVATIGSRPKSINNDKVNAIYFEQIPNVLFLAENE
jgi:hypothetical protein